MKKRYLIPLFSILTITVQAQSVDHEWTGTMGNTEDDLARSITTDGSGNAYIVGGFWGTVDFNPGSGTMELTSSGDRDIFVQKLDGNGNLLWAKALGGSATDEGTSVAVDGSGNVYVTGYFSGTADFDPGSGTSELTSNGFTDIFVVKLTGAGNLSWAKGMGGILDDYGQGIAVDGSGNVLITGDYKDSVDFDPGSGTDALKASGSQSNAFVQKLNSSGNLVWVESMGRFSADGGMDIATDASGNVYTVGFFGSKVDFDPSSSKTELSSKGDRDGFIQKLTSNGGFGWARSIGGTMIDFVQCVTIDGSGNVIVAGYYSDKVDLDPTSGTFDVTSAGVSDVFAVKLNSSGSFTWGKSMGGSQFDLVSDIAHDNSGNIYMCGFFEGTADFDPGSGTAELTSKGDYDFYAVKLDGSGNFKWASSTGGNSVDESYDLAVDGSGHVLITGSFRGTVDFDPGNGTAESTSLGKTDIFIQKLSQSGGGGGTGVVTRSSENTIPSAFPNPTNGQLTINLGQLTDVTIRVYGTNGQLVYLRQNITEPQHELHIDTAEGLYMVEVTTKNSRQQFKVLKM